MMASLITNIVNGLRQQGDDFYFEEIYVEEFEGSKGKEEHRLYVRYKFKQGASDADQQRALITLTQIANANGIHSLVADY